MTLGSGWNELNHLERAIERAFDRSLGTGRSNDMMQLVVPPFSGAASGSAHHPMVRSGATLQHAGCGVCLCKIADGSGVVGDVEMQCSTRTVSPLLPQHAPTIGLGCCATSVNSRLACAARQQAAAAV